MESRSRPGLPRLSRAICRTGKAWAGLGFWSLDGNAYLFKNSILIITLDENAILQGKDRTNSCDKLLQWMLLQLTFKSLKVGFQYM